MLTVILRTWPLLLGVLLLMVGNGIQGSLLGIRGTLESFTTLQVSIVMSAYFLGFLLGSRFAPRMLQQVGHVRVFAALGSVISAILVLYPMLIDWQAWAVMRVLIGFGFAGIYITAESWLNSTTTNETRGLALSAYVYVQMLGIISAQGLLALGDPFGYDLFLIPSVLVSVAFLPLLLVSYPAPTFETAQRLGFRELYRISPLGCVGIFLSGGVFSAMFGMASVWGTVRLLSVSQIALFISTLYIGGMLVQYPIGRMSDRMDRRKLMLWLAIIGAVVMLVAAFVPLPYPALLLVAAVLGGVTYPMYSLVLAYTNDFLKKEQMAAASAGLLFLNGLGSIFGPVLTGWLMGVIGSGGFFLFIGVLYVAHAAYAAYRMTVRSAPAISGAYVGMSPTSSPVAATAAIDSANEIGVGAAAAKAEEAQDTGLSVPDHKAPVIAPEESTAAPAPDTAEDPAPSEPPQKPSQTDA